MTVADSPYHNHVGHGLLSMVLVLYNILELDVFPLSSHCLSFLCLSISDY